MAPQACPTDQPGCCDASAACMASERCESEPFLTPDNSVNHLSARPGLVAHLLRGAGDHLPDVCADCAQAGRCAGCARSS